MMRNDMRRGWWRELRNRGGAHELLPTWQIGEPQEPGDDLERFARHGYSANSLIHACIREVATSFAALTPVVERLQGSRVERLERHRLLDLLADPNSYQDYHEFSELLVTQYLAAGNVYIEKVRGSSSPERRERYGTYAVQELGLIRPEYVRIEPGAQRAADVFAVTIGGVVQRRLPRRDVIHITTPNLINDFYGLSPIALLVREGTIDQSMNAFELAFYDNAGVPFGVIKTKSRHSEDELDEIKGRFRQVLQGVRNWFDVLVLNAEEAEYVQLGLKPADMEQVATREVVESRICAVLGVPPIVVGALVGLKHNRYSNYSQAQASLYSETVIPLAKRVAAALGRELLAEFRTTRDRGARLRFDASEVRALREVELGALKTAGQVFASGVVSDHDALRLAGFATPATDPRFAGEAVSPPDAQPQLEAPDDAELREFFERGE